jgi:hypothetical protein
MCMVCKQPSVREQFDALLESGTNAGEASKRLGISRAEGYRHKKKCFVKRKQLGYRFARFDPFSQRLIIETQPGCFHLHPSGQTLSPAELRANDEILICEYQRPSDEAAANILAAEAAGTEILIEKTRPFLLLAENPIAI